VEGRAQLPPPERPAEPAPAPSGDHTPIFEAARSDWFVAEPPAHRLHRGPAPDGDGVGRGGERPVSRAAGPPPPPPPPVVPPVVPSEEPPAYRPPRVPPPTPPTGPPPARPAAEEPAPYRPEPAHAADEQPPLYRAERARRQDREAPPPVPPAPEPPTYEQAGPRPPAAGPAAPDPATRVTQAGLPRRVPRANLAPGMVATQQAETEPAPGPGSGRSPDEVRSMLSSYRTGIERGRTVAGGSDPGERPPEAP